MPDNTSNDGETELALIAVVEWEDDSHHGGDSPSAAGRGEDERPPIVPATRTKLRINRGDEGLFHQNGGCGDKDPNGSSDCGVTYEILHSHLVQQYHCQLTRHSPRRQADTNSLDDVKLTIHVYDSGRGDYVPLQHERRRTTSCDGDDDNADCCIVRRYGYRVRLRVAVHRIYNSACCSTDKRTREDRPPPPLLQIQGRYYADALRDSRIQVGGSQLTMHQSLNDSLLDAVETGATVWDGAVFLVRYLEFLASQEQQTRPEHTITVRGKNVVELGSGCGLVGIAAAALGAARVVLTDLPYCSRLCEANIEANRCVIIAEQQGSGTRSPPNGKAVNVEFLDCDWYRAPELPERLLSMEVDIVLVADCVWVEELVEPLLTTLDAITEVHPGVAILMSYQRRGRAADDALWTGLHARFGTVEVIDDETHDIDKPPVLMLIECRR